jgi:hypothetical protein
MLDEEFLLKAAYLLMQKSWHFPTSSWKYVCIYDVINLKIERKESGMTRNERIKNLIEYSIDIKKKKSSLMKNHESGSRLMILISSFFHVYFTNIFEK